MKEDERLLTDQLFDRLCQAILDGELAPGAKLSEPQLAQAHGVSRGPLREAIRRLEERKLVTRLPRQGVRVVEPSTTRIAELFAIREVLEGLAAREAAARATAEDILALRALLLQHRRMLEGEASDEYRQSTADADFHFRIARIAGNRMLFDLLCVEYYTLLRFFRRRHRTVPGRARRALIEHERITEAIADGDKELAELMMRRHIDAARKGVATDPGSTAEARWDDAPSSR